MNLSFAVQEGPIDGGYSQWTGWSECSASCGGGVALRTRKCDNPKPTRKGQNCERLGPADNSRKCNQAPCSGKLKLLSGEFKYSLQEILARKPNLRKKHGYYGQNLCPKCMK